MAYIIVVMAAIVRLLLWGIAGLIYVNLAPAWLYAQYPFEVKDFIVFFCIWSCLASVKISFKE